jgi:trimeric autotransporter adhesin
MAKRPVEVEFKLIDGVSKGLASISNGISGVGNALTSVKGLAVQAAAAFGLFKIGSAFAEGVTAAATFEQSLDKISAKTGVTGEALQSLGADIRRIAQDASKTGADGAAAFERLTAEGLSAADALTQLPTALDFATASSQGASEAVGALSDNLDAFGLGADQFARAADVITAGALKGGTGVADLQKALQTVGPTARDLGLSLEQTTATLATLAQNGLEGGKAGKALAAVFDQLRDKNSKFSQELDKAGIKSRDFNAVIAALAAGGTRTQAALNALGVNGTAAVKALGNDGGVALAALTKQLGDVEGATNKTAATINQGLLASFTRLKEAADTALSAFLQPILGPLADEFDSLAAKINEFAASPAFEELKTNFKAAFVEGLAAVKAFIAEFDFVAATKSVQDFVKGAGDNFRELKESVVQVTAAISATFNSLAAVFNGIQTLTGAAVLGVSRTLEKFYGVLGKVSSSAADVSREFKAIADIAEKETGAQAAQLAGNIEALSGNFQELGGAAAAAVPPIADAGTGLDKLGNVIPVVAANAAAAVPSINAVVAALEAAKAPADAASTAMTSFGDSTKLAAENAAINADIAEKSAAGFKKIQDGIQSEIDARKKQAGAIRDAAAATDELAESSTDAQAAIAADAGYSEGALRGLTERVSTIADKFAELKGVSKDSVVDGMTRDIKGAIFGLTEANNAAARLEQEFERLGGQKALDQVRARTEALAEAMRNAAANARNAVDEISAMNDALESDLAARGGDSAAQERARFEQELARIDELDKKSGNTDQAAFDRARALAKAKHEANLADIAAEAKARVDSELGADAAIAASRGGQSAAPAGGGSGALGPSAPATAAPGPITINISALDLRNADRFIDDIGSALERKRRNSL